MRLQIDSYGIDPRFVRAWSEGVILYAQGVTISDNAKISEFTVVVILHIK
jgi:hypothetical protein